MGHASKTSLVPFGGVLEIFRRALPLGPSSSYECVMQINVLTRETLSRYKQLYF